MKPWFSIVNKTAETAEISIYDEIGSYGVTSADFLTSLKAVGDRRIVLRINSPGGDVFHGIAIYNRLKEHAPGVEVRIDGLAASMASVIAMCGAPVKMAGNAMLMIHNPTGLCWGEAGELRQLAGLLDQLRNSLSGAYEKKTGKSAAKIAELMDAETWLSAAEAKQMGFVDDVTEPLKIAASFDMSKFRNAGPRQPSAVAPAINAPNDAVSAAFSRAQAESDPTRRAMRFAEASRLIEAGAGASHKPKGDRSDHVTADSVKAAFEAAKAEPDPTRRARLFSRASQLLQLGSKAA